MKKEIYNHWSTPMYLRDIVKNPLIEVGDYSYYSGYYGAPSFEDGCVRFMWGDTKSQALFNPIKENGWKLDRLIIGNFVCIASGATILMGGNHNHRSDWLSIYPFAETIQESFFPKGDTIIESDAWIGMNALIMPGVKIGCGAIVAAGSIVTKDVPAYTVVGGNPAKIIKERFDKDTRNKLLEMRWFDWDQELLKEAIPLISSDNIEGLYAYYLANVK